mmetsp:Transcript_13288/g.11374  ORF Transcript_13288/g.11374 Transcript_13288/m.11374 type:complete len:135 (-) Transcript_13288:747-1151(-)
MVKNEEDIYKLLSMDSAMLKIFCIESIDPHAIETLIIILLSLKRITTLELILQNCPIFDSVTFDSFCQILDERNQLISLHLDFKGCTSLANIETIAASFLVLNMLESLHLNFSDCKDLTSHSIESIGNGLAELK